MKWMKSGVEQQPYWLLQKTGMTNILPFPLVAFCLGAPNTPAVKLCLLCFIPTCFVRYKQSNASLWERMGAGEHQRLGVLQGEL